MKKILALLGLILSHSVFTFNVSFRFNNETPGLDHYDFAMVEVLSGDDTEIDTFDVNKGATSGIYQLDAGTYTVKADYYDEEQNILSYEWTIQVTHDNQVFDLQAPPQAEDVAPMVTLPSESEASAGAGAKT